MSDEIGMNIDRPQCPGCASERRSGQLEFVHSPVVLNYRFATAQEAVAVPRGRLLLRQCDDCGLIFNSAFDPDAIPYDERYENTQCCSSAFLAHLNEVADRLAVQHCLDKNSIIEIGCGKGDFLKLLIEKTSSQGYGYDTSCEQNGWNDDRSICFYRRYLTPGEITKPASLIICRHVVEHVQDIGGFFDMLFKISVECGNAPVYIETPDWDWIADNGAHWDIFYEHCNYFSMPTLANLAMAAGFEIVRHESLFGMQYQGMDIKPSSSRGRARLRRFRARLEDVAPELKRARRLFTNHIQATFGMKRWAIWGAGAKGVCLANAIGTSSPPNFLIDSNPAKQGGFIAGTDLKILSPVDARLRQLDAVLVANPNYLSEIKTFTMQNELAFSLSSI